MRRVFALGLAMFCVAMANAVSAGAQEQLAASCDPPADSTTTGWADLAQSFAPQVTGTLTRAELAISKSGPDNSYVVQIRSVDATGAPADSVLASTTIPDASVPTGDSVLSASFAHPASVVAGQHYALVVTGPSNLSVGYRINSPCQISAWFSDTGMASDWSDLSADTYDLVFKVFVTPPQPTGQRAAALKKCKKKAHKNHWSKKRLKKCKKKAKLLPV